MSRTVASVIQIKHNHSGISITADTDNSLFDVLEHADNALVDVKKCSRNLVRFWMAGNIRVLNTIIKSQQFKQQQPLLVIS
ncbi:MAG: hypothetical protein A3G96_01140 [Gammaproteobacteria bacterium RIFCSPLOWO2_12_FULL_52_10]|nr:MAG: hypothetical protein A3G96_01140 [Gammaproteobacteria bacterium RIFCSPLOWO2_12_FULL_52_10]